MRSVDFEGTVRSFAGSCPTVTFTIGQARVYVTSKTDFKKGACRDLSNGRDVDVEGMLMTDGRVRADKITLKNEEDD